MFFKNLSKKIDLIEQAISSENDFEKLEKRLKGLHDKENSIKKKIVGKKKKVEIAQLKVAQLNDTVKKINLEVRSLQEKIAEKESYVTPLKQQWNQLDAVERKLRKYFGDIS